jgi:hypothetical protein
MREKSLALGQRHCREVSNHAGRGFFWSDKAEKKGHPLTLCLAPTWLNSPCVLLFFVPKRVCLCFGFWHQGLLRRKKPISS